MKPNGLSKVEQFDRITTLPQAVVETILCLLPTEEAARTSVLSREWRYKWTTIPKVIFLQSDEKQPPDSSQLSDLESARKNMDTRCKLLSTIHQVLLQRQGPIHDFTLSMEAHSSFLEIDQIILHLSRNHTIKKLTFDFHEDSSYRLPLSLFSLHHLTDLYLENCEINHKPVFSGFVSLTSLSLVAVQIYSSALLHLLSKCPSLKSLCLISYEGDFLNDEKSSIMDLFKCLPMIEDLAINGSIIRSLVEASVPQELSASLIHLKSCSIIYMFDEVCGLPFLGALIKCSPNLEKLNLETNWDKDGLFEEYSHILEESSDVLLEHLHELEFEDFGNSKVEIDFVKFLLARLPNLKKVILRPWMREKSEELELLNILLSAPRLSPVEIIVVTRFNDYDD